MKKVFFYATFYIAGICFSQTDTAVIKKHFTEIINPKVARNHENVVELNRVAAYIHGQFSLYGDSTVFQEYQVGNQVYKNVITSFGNKNNPRIIIGAHYDVCGNQDGADDNASGVIGLLEIARQLDTSKLKYRVDLVAYSLEEPPYFRSENMGSYVHAEYLYDKKINVYGMICLEMIGYFSDEKKSQSYPLGILKLIYGGKGDFITVVRKTKSGRFAKKYKSEIKKIKLLKTKSFQGPAKLVGIDFSDHLNYWKFGYSAVMITNTGFFRNKNYHLKYDQVSTIDFYRMALVIDETIEAVYALK